MKRASSLIILAALLLSLLSACGGTAAKPTDSPKPTVPVATAKPAATEAVATEAAEGTQTGATEGPEGTAVITGTEAPEGMATETSTEAAEAVKIPAFLATLTSKVSGLKLGTIKIATQTPLSGGQSALGIGIRNGAELAIKQLNTVVKDAGVTFELVPFDDQAKAEVGSANAKNIVSDADILCVDGHLNSGVALASLPDYSNAKLAMISPANTNPKITDGGYSNAFRVVGRDDVQGAVGEQFARETLKIKSVYILHDKTDYGQGVAEFFRLNAEKNGVKVLNFEGTEEKSDFSSILTPIQAANPDLIYFGGLYDQAGPFFRQARDRGITAKFLGPDGMDSPDLAKLAGDAVEGMYYTTIAAPVSQFPNAAQYAKDYKTEYKGDAPPFSAQSYDATSFCVSAILTAAADAGAKPTREQVTAAMKALLPLGGITGDYKFNAKGDITKAAYYVMQANTKDWNTNKLISKLEIAPPK